VGAAAKSPDVGPVVSQHMAPRVSRRFGSVPVPPRWRSLPSFLQIAPILAAPTGALYALGGRTRAYPARVAKLADAPDLGSGGCKNPWGFDSPLSHHSDGASMTLVYVVCS